MKRGLCWAALAIAFAALALPALAAPKFPALSGRVVDQANVLSPAAEADLTGKLADLEQRTSRQLVVVTVPSLEGEEIEDYGYQLGRAWGIGSKESNNGALFIVAPNDRKVRIEVGYGLEGVLTDALSSMILQTTVLPKFRTGDIEAGVVGGTNAIVEQLSLPDEEAKAKVVQASARPKKSNGGPPVFLVLFVLFVVFGILGGLGGRRRRSNGLASALPWIILGSLNSRGGGWGGGGGGGWSSGGGGFSGGGGSFGGGGSSGSW